LTGDAEFYLLGPLLVRSHGEVVPIPAGKQRALLAMLLLNANRVVPVDDLVDALWGSNPPASARVTIQNYIKRLRASLRADDRGLIHTQPPGYLISADMATLDVLRFDSLFAATRLAATDQSWDEVAQLSRSALELWRGEPLADVNSDLLAASEVPRLAEQRLQAREARIDADLHLGRQAEVIGELRQLTGTHRYRERLHGLLMIALARNGQRAEALAAYATVRQILTAELGIEPGADLRAVHGQILAGEHDAQATAPPRRQRASDLVIPRQLPAPTSHFAGRSAELDALTGMLDDASTQHPAPLLISAIGGTAGVGKTALAVHWAHRVAGRFSGGQLYVNLRGYDPGQPMPATDALAGFLSALGVPGPDIPAEADDRAGRYRSLLADRQVLVVLDNARSVDQVRPLLPGTITCAVIVTSRDSLAGLVARDGARRLDLDLLPQSDAISLLRALIGTRVDTDPGSAKVLAEQCARLPLALRVAAELAAARKDSSLAELTGELADQQRRLDLLDAGGDSRTAVRAVFSWSYRHLDPSAARTFRLLGAHPGADFDAYAAAALTGSSASLARDLLDQLARAHLVYPAGPGRYGMHDLLRAYAAERASHDDEAAAFRQSLTSLFDYYLSTAATAARTLFPTERYPIESTLPAAADVPPVADRAAALAWLDSERATLVAVVAHAASHGWPAAATQLAGALFRYLDTGGHYAEAVIVHGHARRAAAQTGDRIAEASALTSLGVVDVWQGRYQQAADHLKQAIGLSRQAGDLSGEARALHLLGNVGFQQGRYEQAADHFQWSLDLYRKTGDEIEVARALGNLGVVDQRQGRFEQAADHLRQSLALCRAVGDLFGEAHVLGNLGVVDQRQGNFRQAIEDLTRSLELFRQAGNRTGEAHALIGLGDIDRQLGRQQQALEVYQRAYDLFTGFGDQSGQAEALNGLGDALLVTSGPGDAYDRHRTALNLASQIGDREQQARAHDGLGAAHHATGDLESARQHWRIALSIYSTVGAPEAAQVMERLASLA
jgi:DNA-binding SARP family transcriptional activator/tetratricopeptide (TPR) repeat protein